MQNIEIPKAGGGWIGSGIIYASYNLVRGVMFFTTLGKSADTRKEAVYGGIIGSIVIMSVILVMNLALLSKVDSIHKLSIPTLYFAKSISPLLGKIFLSYYFVVYSQQQLQTFGLYVLKFLKRMGKTQI